MSMPEDNKRVVARYVEAFNKGDFATLRGLFTEDAVIHGVFGWGTIDAVMPIWHDLHHGLAMTLTVEDMIAEDDKVAVLYTESGQFNGPFRGHAPTGKRYEIKAMEWFSLRDGKIARRWGARDSAAQARQIGLG